MKTAIPLPTSEIESFCRRWKIVRLEVFGSVLTGEFGPDSDVDFLAEWAPDARVSLYDLVRAERELAGIMGRRVDLHDRKSIEQSPNWLLRQSILQKTGTVYASA